MAKLSNDQKLTIVSNANSLLAECGWREYATGDWTRYASTPTKYYKWASGIYWDWWKKGSRSRKYKQEHKDYLTSFAWQVVRNKRLQIDGHKCVDCNAEAECVHHVTYERWKQENINTDLVSLCNKCHYARHFPAGIL